MTISEDLADFILRTSFDALPPHIVASAKLLVLDHIGAAAIGATQPWSRIAEEVGRSTRGVGLASVYFSDRPPLPPTTAAFINGTYAHAFEFDDHCLGAHLGCVIIPAALATAATKGVVTGREVITAIVLGYELMIRVADAMGSISHVGHHTTGSMGPFGSATATARVLGLSQEKIVSALGLAGNFPTGVCEFHHGSQEKRIFAGRAAEAGVLACQLSERGLTGPRTIFEGDFGFCRAFSRDVKLERLTDELGRRFLLEDVRIKLYPCAGKVAPFIDTALKMRAAHAELIDTDRIVGIRVEGNSRTLDPRRVNVAGIRQVMGAQYSIPYGIVAALHRGQVTPDEFTEATICSAGIQTLLDRCTVHTAANYPGMGRIELTLDDGSIREAEVFESRKTIIEVDQDRLLAKFRGIATPLFGERAADQVISTIERLEDIADVRELVDALPLLPR